MVKLFYEKPVARFISVDATVPFLAGSVTDYSIKIAEVEVADYGFGFSDDPNHAIDSGFDVTFD